jgi:hypothetical protein
VEIREAFRARGSSGSWGFTRMAQPEDDVLVTKSGAGVGNRSGFSTSLGFMLVTEGTRDQFAESALECSFRYELGQAVEEIQNLKIEGGLFY